MPGDVKRPELFRLIRQAGWMLDRDHGSHAVFKKDGRSERVALGGNETMGGGGLKEIAKRFGFTVPGMEAPKRRGGVREVQVPQEGTFGWRIYTARTKVGMSQGDLARACGVQQAQISAWERNVVSPFNEHGLISFKVTKTALGKMADLFGWEDIRLKAGHTVEPPKQKVEEKALDQVKLGDSAQRVVDSGAYNQTALLKGKTTSPSAASKDLLKLLDTGDIMQWLVDQDNVRRRQQGEINRLLRQGNKEDIETLRRKAAAYDRIMAAAEEPKEKAEPE